MSPLCTCLFNELPGSFKTRLATERGSALRCRRALLRSATAGVRMPDKSSDNELADLSSFLTFRLTDEKWNRLVALSQCLTAPDKARADLEDCIKWYLFALPRHIVWPKS